MANEKKYESEDIFETETQDKPVAKRGRPKANVEQRKNDDIAKYAEENNELRKENAQMKKEVCDLKDQMSKVLELLAIRNTKEEKKEQGTVKIGCRSLAGSCLRNKDESIIYEFRVGEERDVDVEDLKQIFKDGAPILKNRALFEKGIFYFVDEKEYQKWGIKKRVDLSWDTIRKLVTMPDANEMIRKIKDITRDKTDLAITHCLKFTVAQMIVDRTTEPLRGWRYENRIALENYLGNKFDDLIANIGLYNLVRRMNG